MPSDTETERFEAQGSNALATLKAALSGFDFDSETVVRAAVEVDIEKPDPEPDGGSRSKSSSNGCDRELKKARADTQIHYALAFLAAADEPLSPDEASEQGDLNKQQFSSAFSRGYRRMLLDRDPFENGYGYRYTVNQHGLAELERLGTPTLDGDE